MCIGVFDSGVGGLSVAGRILERMPSERIIYFADNAHVPYGERPLEEIREFALAITEFVVGQGAKAVVMACNMSSAVALKPAREMYPGVPIIGVINPGARAAVSQARGKPIGIFATTGTVMSGAYSSVIHTLDSKLQVIEQPCPEFVPLVESGKAETQEAEIAVRKCAKLLIDQNISTLVLGCTHYPFLREAISSAFGPDVTLIDPAEETVEELHKLLREENLLAKESDVMADHRFFSSGETDSFAHLGSLLLGRRIDSVEYATWGVDLGKVLV